MVPDGWEIRPLKNLIDKRRKIRYGIVQPGQFDPNGRYMVRGQDYSKGWADRSALFRVSDDVEQRYKKARLKAGDLVLTIVGAGTGHVAKVPGWLEGANITQTTARIAVDPSVGDTDYIWLYLQSRYGRRLTYQYRKGGAQPGLNIRDVEKYRILTPPLQEQHRISSLLTNWDQAIDQAQELIGAKIRVKEYLIQQLIGREGSKGSEVRLGDFLIPISRPVARPNREYQALGLRSHGKGTFKRVVDEPEKIMMDTLYEVKHNDLIVNITFAWEGAIALVNADDEGCLVSHRFPTYRICEDVVLVDYVRYLVLRRRFIYDLGVISPGGAGRNRVLSKNNFLKLSVWLPDIHEQRRVASLLTEIHRDIEILHLYLGCLERQKRGLMQVVLTGKVRIRPSICDGGAR